MQSTEDLIDKLIAHWGEWAANEEYYLTVLAPSIVCSDGLANLDDYEKRIVRKLRRQLSMEGWSQLPTLIAQRRVFHQERDEADRQARRKASKDLKRQREEQERSRRELERKRKQMELERLQEQEVQARRKAALIVRLNDVFVADFLSADARYTADPDSYLLAREEYDELKARFVERWAMSEPKRRLDLEQAAAVAATRGDVQVIARAGSGKTRTLVTRAIFLQKHCQVSPRELLLLAFNKKAAKEMKSRLEEAIGTDLPHVMTFHALAYALVHPNEEIVYDNSSADQFGLSREVQNVIDEHVRSKKYGGRIRELMLAHFRDDWERIVAGRFERPMKELLVYRRALPRETLKGEYVKSYGEKVIANGLFEHGVEYQYERNFRWSGINYRPDFTIRVGTKGGVVIEYFGLEGDADYDIMSEKKRQFWKSRPEWTFIEFSPKNLAQGDPDNFVKVVLGELGKVGIHCKRRTEQEIWGLVKDRAVDSFTRAMTTFVGRCRKRNLSPDDLESAIHRHKPYTRAEALFLEIGVSVYRGYLQYLSANKKDDFDGLIRRAVLKLREGQTEFARDKGREHGDTSQLRFVMIDEFQDFSQMFFELANAIRSVNPSVQFFCVGDDWQAINGFAGSDLRFFTDFASYFRNTSRRDILTNYRSATSIVESGNALMHGRGSDARSKLDDTGLVWLCLLDKFNPTSPEQATHIGDEITPALLRVIRSFLDRELDVVMLSRRNGLPWFVNYSEAAGGKSDPLKRFLRHIHTFLPEEDRKRVTISTTHSFKGLEKSGVIVLDAKERSYPLIHPHWVFLRIFGDSVERIIDEERRLFYVAITRAKDSLALFTETSSQSPFLIDIGRRFNFPSFAWSDLPPVSALNGARLEVRVSIEYTAYELRNNLKQMEFKYSAGYWHKTVLAEGFSMDSLLAQPWARQAVKVEVFSETGELLHRR